MATSIQELSPDGDRA